MGLNWHEEEQAKRMAEGNVRSVEQCRQQLKNRKVIAEMFERQQDHAGQHVGEARPEWIENLAGKGAFICSILGIFYGYYEEGLDPSIIFYFFAGLIGGFYIVELTLAVVVGSVIYACYAAYHWFF